MSIMLPASLGHCLDVCLSCVSHGAKTDRSGRMVGGVRWEPPSRVSPASDGALGQYPHFIKHAGFSPGLKLKDRPSDRFVCFLIPCIPEGHLCVYRSLLLCLEAICLQPVSPGEAGVLFVQSARVGLHLEAVRSGLTFCSPDHTAREPHPWDLKRGPQDPQTVAIVASSLSCYVPGSPHRVLCYRGLVQR